MNIHMMFNRSWIDDVIKSDFDVEVMNEYIDRSYDEHKEVKKDKNWICIPNYTLLLEDGELSNKDEVKAMLIAGFIYTYGQKCNVEGMYRIKLVTAMEKLGFSDLQINEIAQKYGNQFYFYIGRYRPRLTRPKYELCLNLEVDDMKYDLETRFEELEQEDVDSLKEVIDITKARTY